MNRTTQPPADNSALWPAALRDELPQLRARLIPQREFTPHRLRWGRFHKRTVSIDTWQMRRAAADVRAAEGVAMD